MEAELITGLSSAIQPFHTHDSTADEDALVAKAREGCLAAFEQLVERYKTKVFRLAQTLARTREDAEEIAQDAFIKAFRNLSKFRGDSRFYTWLVRITINEGLMKARGRRLRLVSIDDLEASGERTPPPQLVDGGPTPEQRYSRRELQNILSTTIRQLRPRYRAVVHLRGIEGLSTRQIARALDLSQTAVKSRLRRARMKMRDSLEGYFQFGSAKNAAPSRLV